MGNTASGALLAEFESHLNSLALSPTTVVNYLADVRAFVSWLANQEESPAEIVQVRARDIRRYCRYLETVEKRARATINRRLQALRKFFRFAYEAGWMKHNPAAHVNLLPDAASSPPRTLSAEEVERLLQAGRDSRPSLAGRDEAILRLMLGAGLRVSELVNLRMDDLVLRNGQSIVIVRSQNGASERRIPLNPATWEALRQYLEIRPPVPDVPQVFLSQRGTPISARSVQRLVAERARAAGLKNVSPSTLRHTCAAMWLAEGDDVAEIARRLGHQRLETTVKYLSLPRNAQRA